MQGCNKFNNLFQVLYGYFNNIWLIGVHIYVCTNIYTKCVKFQQKTLNCKVVGAHQSFPQLCKTFCVFILTMHILFCHTNQRNMLQKVITDWILKVYLLSGEPSSSLLPTESLKMTVRVYIVFCTLTSCPKTVK